MRKLAVTVGAIAIVGTFAESGSAASIGLVPDGGCLVFNGARICDADLKPTGTGIFDPFLRTNPGGNLSPSSGFNTDANIDSALNDADDSWTSALAKSGLQVTPDGYVVFSVDINQIGEPDSDESKLSLAHFQLFSCTTATYTALTAAQGCSSFYNLFGGTLTRDAGERPDIATSTWVDIDYRIHSSGSGKGDINVFVPVSVFTGTSSYIALLDGWGQPGTYVDNDGFQEWRALSGISECPVGEECDDITVPEPALMLLFGMAALGSARRLRRHSTAP